MRSTLTQKRVENEDELLRKQAENDQLIKKVQELEHRL